MISTSQSHCLSPSSATVHISVLVYFVASDPASYNMCFYIPNKPPCTCVFLQLVQPCNGARLFPSTNPTNPNPIIQVCGTRILARGAGQRYCHQCAAHHEALGATPTTVTASVDRAHDTGTLISYSQSPSMVSRRAQVPAHPTTQTQQLALRPHPSAADNKKTLPVNRNLAELKGKGRTSPRHRRSPSGSKKQIPRSVPMSGSSVSSTSSQCSNDSSSSGSDHSVAMIPGITITAAPIACISQNEYSNFGMKIGMHGISGEMNEYSHPQDSTTTNTIAHFVEPCIESDQTGEGTLMSYGDVRFLVDLPDDERRDSNCG